MNSEERLPEGSRFPIRSRSQLKPPEPGRVYAPWFPQSSLRAPSIEEKASTSNHQNQRGGRERHHPRPLPRSKNWVVSLKSEGANRSCSCTTMKMMRAAQRSRTRRGRGPCRRAICPTAADVCTTTTISTISTISTCTRRRLTAASSSSPRGSRWRPRSHPNPAVNTDSPVTQLWPTPAPSAQTCAQASRGDTAGPRVCAGRVSPSPRR